MALVERGCHPPVVSPQLDLPSRSDFTPKPGRVLDLYAGSWEGRTLGKREFVLCADEKTGIQVRRRLHQLEAAGPGRPVKVEHEYERLGTLAYLAAWDVHRGKLFGRLEAKSDIPAFDRLMGQLMGEEP